MIAIDLGSNTFRVITYDVKQKCFGNGFERIVGTAEGMHEHRCIGEAAVDRILQAAREAQTHFDFQGEEVVAMTTAAMRMADNATEVLARIERDVGIRFRIIDEEEEATYTALAVRHRLEQLHLPRKHFVLIDIGGGSTEVMFYRDGHFESKSFPVGIVSIAQRCETPDGVRKLLDNALAPVRDYVQGVYAVTDQPQTFVATAGTPTTIAAFLQGMTYATYDAEKINGTVLTRAQCDEALQGLLALDDATRAVYVGVGKETLIVAGVVIVQAFYEVLGFEEAIIVDDGLREGIALAYGQGDLKGN